MYRVLGFLFVVSFMVFQGTLGQNECVPDPVENLTLSLDYTLSWLASENCDVTHYIVYIHSDDGLEYIYQTDDTKIDVAFLPACERYRFTIMAYDQHMSSATYIITNIPAPPGANLTMSSFNFVEREDGILLHWEVEYQYAHCAQYYRIIVWDYESAPRDIYTSYNDYVLNDLVPCSFYEFGVMAIYNSVVEGPVSLKTYEAPPVKSSPPILQSVVPGSTFFNITWSLPTYTENRCTITSVNVDASPNFNSIFPVIDSPDRPPFTTSLSPLRADSMYYALVTVVNGAGASDPYRIGVQTLPAN